MSQHGAARLPAAAFHSVAPTLILLPVLNPILCACVFQLRGGRLALPALLGCCAFSIWFHPNLLTSTPCSYVVGDSRFQRYCKSNPRKMVKMWAEKVR